MTVGLSVGVQFGPGSYSAVACSCWVGDAGGPPLSIFKDLGL